MRKIALLCCAILALSLSAMAQDQPRIDAFAGYSYVRVNLQGDVHSNLNGGSGSVAFYPSRWWGVVGDFGGYKISTLTQAGASASVDGSVVTYLFGPRIRFGGDKITPFAHALFGGAHLSDVTSSGSPLCPTSATCTVTSSDNAFATALGGGIDVKVSRHFSIRGQAEYLMTRFKDVTSSTGARATQNNARISAGVVIH